MTFYSERASFRGNINGKTVKNLRNMDFSLENSKERIEYVENILNECDELLKQYNDKYYKVNTTNELSSDIDLYKNLELLGTYLLNSKDLPTESKQEYKIYTDEKLFLKAVKEIEGDYENSIAFLKTNRRNEYIVNPLSIEDKDFEDERLKEYLTPYKNMLDYLSNQLSLARKGEKIEIKNIKLAKKIAKELKDDMILTKEKIIRPIKLPNNGDFSPIYDWEQFDYTNKNHIRAMLYINRPTITPDDDVSLISYDVKVAIKELYNNGKMDKKDLKILYLLKKEKSYTFEDIGYELKMTKQAVNGRINRIINKLIRYFEEKKY